MLTARDNRIFLGLMLALVALAWLSLLIWGRSPYGRYLHHDGLADIRLSSDAGLLVVFIAGWTLMTVAMMLPTSLPLIELFERMTAARPDRGRLVGLLIAGYLTVWTLFGVVAYVTDLGIHQAVSRIGILERHEWVIGSGALLLAGLYQFTDLKYRCLDACRSPRTFIASHWQGRDEYRQSFRLGIRHGLFCVGCCWSLMLLMFLVGIGSLLWMFLLGGVMAVEKNLSWGRQLSRPLGSGLVSAGFAIALQALR